MVAAFWLGWLSLALVVQAPAGVGFDKAQLPWLPTGRHRAVRAAVRGHLELDAFFVSASIECWYVVRRSHSPIVQQLGVVAPVPGVGQGEFGGQPAIAGEGGVKIDAGDSFG